MKTLVGTKTAECLARAFAGESQARNRYTFYSEAAHKEGYADISKIFKDIADNEKAHAKVFFNLLIQGGASGNIKVDGGYPADIGKTVDNLKFAAEGEYEEWTDAYPSFAAIAKEEGFTEVENAFNLVITVEKQHHKIYEELHEKMNNNALYKSTEKQYWECGNCGYIYEGTEVPAKCPLCNYPQGYFKING